MSNKLLIERMAVRVRWFLAVVFIGVWLSVVGSMLYVAAHFIAKYW